MKFYLAAAYGRLELMQKYKGMLEYRGHVVTSRWVNGNHAMSSNRDECVRFAREDLADIYAADTLLAFTEEQDSPIKGRGGRHVEFGFAVGMEITVIVIGPYENIFHYLPSIQRYATWETFLRNYIGNENSWEA